VVKRYHILVVDDEPSVRRAIQMLLGHDGHEVRTVDSGETALALLEQDLFDLVITDYSMEGMKGDQLAAIIKQRWPGQPVILATAFAADFPHSSTPSGGVDYVLSKPFSVVELREAIAWVMSQKAAPSATPDESASLANTPEVPPPDFPPPEPPESSSGRIGA
jgi:two-component system cell cycle response regulator CpdR